MKYPVAITLAITLALQVGCRADPGVPDYSSHDGIRGEPIVPTEVLEGPDPYVPGERRLDVGLFYEGGSSERVIINGITTHYFIFQIEGSGQLTYSQQASDERVEGNVSDEIKLTGTPWWGGGIIWDTPTDLSSWSTMSISLRSEDAAFADVDVKMLYGADAISEAAVKASAYGYSNDGEWYSLTIPVQDFVDAGLDPTLVRGPLVLGGVAGASGEALLVDNVYFE